MRKGYFYNKNTLELIKPEDLEKELPEKFRFDSMIGNKYPKYEYISLLGIICCAGCSCIDRTLLDIILKDNILYDDSVEFLCNRYRFYCHEII